MIKHGIFGHGTALWLGGLLLGLTACTGSGQPALPFLPTSTPTVTPTATMTATPTATPTPTPTPTPNPARIRATAEAGQSQVQGQLEDGSTLVCLRQEDTDGDGAPEWLALAHRTAPQGWLSAFILDGTNYYRLEPAPPDEGKPDLGLGEYATCELQIRDVNADGRVEIAIFGHAQNSKTLMHLYVWNGSAYQRLGDFSGDAGVRFESRDGDLADEIVVGYRDQAAPDLGWYVINTWDGQTYGWTTDRYDWYFLDRPHSYLTHKAQYAVISFYLALDDRDLPGAYALLSPEAQAASPYADWVTGFDTTLQVEVGGAHPIPGTGDDTHTWVTAMVTAWDNEGGHVIGRLWNVEWETVLTPDGWRLVQAKTTVLDEWETTFWP